MPLKLTEEEKSAINDFKEEVLYRIPAPMRAIILFGSKARGELTIDSDIDILIVVNQESLDLWSQIHEISSRVSLRYNVLISVKVMSSDHLFFLKKINSAFIRNIEKEGTNLWTAA